MKAFSDEEMQKMLEQGTLLKDHEFPVNQKEELEAYNFLFKELKKEPDGGLPYDFSVKVVSKVAQKVSFKSDIKTYLLALVVLILSVTGLNYLSSYFDYSLSVQFNHLIMPYKWIIIFAAVMFFTIQYLDQKLVKKI